MFLHCGRLTHLMNMSCRSKNLPDRTRGDKGRTRCSAASSARREHASSARETHQTRHGAAPSASCLLTYPRPTLPTNVAPIARPHSSATTAPSDSVVNTDAKRLYAPKRNYTERPPPHTDITPPIGHVRYTELKKIGNTRVSVWKPFFLAVCTVSRRLSRYIISSTTRASSVGPGLPRPPPGNERATTDLAEELLSRELNLNLRLGFQVGPVRHLVRQENATSSQDNSRWRASSHGDALLLRRTPSSITSSSVRRKHAPPYRHHKRYMVAAYFAQGRKRQLGVRVRIHP